MDLITRKDKTKYVLQGYVVGTWYLIPFVPHWNREPSDCELWKKYWEPHYAKKETWIPINKVNWSDFDITEAEYLKIKEESEKSDKEILAKYHASF